MRLTACGVSSGVTMRAKLLLLGALGDVGQVGRAAAEDEAERLGVEGGQGDVELVVARDDRLVGVAAEVVDAAVGADRAHLEPLGGLAPEAGVAAEFAVDGLRHRVDQGGAEQPVLGQRREQGQARDSGEAVGLGEAGAVGGAGGQRVDEQAVGGGGGRGAAQAVVVGLAVAGDEQHGRGAVWVRPAEGGAGSGVGDLDDRVAGVGRGRVLGRAGRADALQAGEGGGVGVGGGVAGRAGQPHEADGGTGGGVAAVAQRVREAGRDDGLAVAGQGGGDEDARHGGMIATARTTDAAARRCRRAGMGV